MAEFPKSVEVEVITKLPKLPKLVLTGHHKDKVVFCMEPSGISVTLESRQRSWGEFLSISDLALVSQWASLATTNHLLNARDA